MQKQPKFDPKKLEKMRPGKLPRSVITVDTTEKKPPSPNVRWLSYCAVGVLTLCMMTFVNAMMNGFVFNDQNNYAYVRDIAADRDFWITAFVNAMSAPFSAQLVKISYAIDVLGFGGNSGYAHWTNMLLHTANSLLLFAFVFRIAWILKLAKSLKLNPYVLATAAAAFFACHPLPGGSVSYVSGRPALMLGFFSLLSLHSFMSGFMEHKVGKAAILHAVSILFLLCGVFTSYQIVFVPFLSLALITLVRPHEVSLKTWFVNRWAEYFLGGACGITLLILSAFKFPKLVDNGFFIAPMSVVPYVATQMKALITYYLRCLIAPFGLSVDPPMVLASSFADPLVIVGAALLGSLVYLCWRWRRDAMLFTGAAFIVAGILPWVLHIQAEYVSDQRFYVPMFGISILVGYGFARLFEIKEKRRLLIIAGSVVLLGLSVLSMWRTVGWRDPSVLWWQAFKLNKDSRMAEGQIAFALSSKQKLEDAKKHADLALKVSPNDIPARTVLASYAYSIRKYIESALELEKVLKIETDIGMVGEQTVITRRDIASSYLRANNLEKAAPYSEGVKQILKNDAQMHLIAGKLYLRAHLVAQALGELQTAYKLNPNDNEVFLPLATAINDTSDPRYMVTAFKLAAASIYTERSPEALLQATRAAIGVGKLQVAAERLNIAVTMDRQNPGCMYLTAVLLGLNGDTKNSERIKELAKKLDKNVEQSYSVVVPNEEIVAQEKRRFSIELEHNLIQTQARMGKEIQAQEKTNNTKKLDTEKKSQSAKNGG